MTLRSTSTGLLLVLVSCVHLAACVGPLCFSCSDAFHPAVCAQFIKCQDDELCVTTKRRTNVGSELYETGCRAKTACNSQATPTASSTLCTECCSGTLCNVDGCKAPPLLNKQNNETFCASCPSVLNPKDCDKVKKCSSAESCGITIKTVMSIDFAELGCIDKTSCPKNPTTLAHDKQLCCDDDLCNTNDLGVKPMYYTTTPKPPPGPANASFDSNYYKYNLTHKPGEKMELVCHVRGGPKPKVTWHFENSSVSVDITRDIHREANGDSVLTVYNPSKSDAGKYTCTAENILALVTDYVDVDIASPPFINGSSNITVIAELKDTVELECDVDNENGTVNVSWIIPPEVTSYSIDVTNVTNTLTLYNVHEENQVVYICVAENNEGQSKKYYTLQLNNTLSTTSPSCTCPTQPTLSCPPTFSLFSLPPQPSSSSTTP